MKIIENEISINYSQIAKALLNFPIPENLKDSFGGVELEELKAGDYSSIAQYFEETQNWPLLNGLSNFYHIEPDNIRLNSTLDPEFIFKPISDFSNWVARSYDEEQYPWELSAWDEGYCSGDDDVNYNSSYLDLVIELIQFYLSTLK